MGVIRNLDCHQGVDTVLEGNKENKDKLGRNIQTLHLHILTNPLLTREEKVRSQLGTDVSCCHAF